MPIPIDGGDPVFIELCGSVFDEHSRPAHLSVEQVKMRFSSRVERTDFDTRERLFRAGDIVLSDGFLHFADEPPQAEPNGVESLFESDLANIPAISLSENWVDFGRCIPDGTINAVPIQLTNHTDGEVVAQWYQSTEKGPV